MSQEVGPDPDRMGPSRELLLPKVVRSLRHDKAILVLFTVDTLISRHDQSTYRKKPLVQNVIYTLNNPVKTMDSVMAITANQVAALAAEAHALDITTAA